MTVNEAIAELNATRLQTVRFRDCVDTIIHAAVFGNNSDAQNFIFLTNWKPTQTPN